MVTEEDPQGSGFLAEVMDAWERATEPAQQAGIRTVLLRSGSVQSPHGGRLAGQLLPFKLGLGGRIGSGQQYLSWISMPDDVAAITFCLTESSIEGPVNVTAPAPVTNAEFAKTLGRVLHRPAVVPIPLVLLRRSMDEQALHALLLGGVRALPAKLEKAGFRWAYPTLEATLREALAG